MKKEVHQILQSRRPSQRGATMVFVAICLIALFAMTAVAIDFGMMYMARQRAQATADGAALAAGRLLNGTLVNGTNAAANQAAQDVVNATNGTFGMTFYPGAQNSTTLLSYPTSGTYDDTNQPGWSTTQGNAVTATGYVNAPISFAMVVGFKPSSWNASSTANTQSVPATATVVLEPPCTLGAGQSVLPFGFMESGAAVPYNLPTANDANGDQDTLNMTINEIYYLMNPSGAPWPFSDATSLKPSTYDPLEIILKSGTWSGNSIGTSGNFGLLSLNGGNGGAGVRADIEDPLGTPVSIGGTATTKPGNTVGPLGQGMSDRLSAYNSSTGLGTNWDPGNSDLDISGLPGITTGAYDQWYNYGQSIGWASNAYSATPTASSPSSFEDGRIVAIPIIATITKGGNSSVTFVGFAGVFLEGLASKSYNWRTTDPTTGKTLNWYAENGDVIGRLIYLTESGEGGPCTQTGTDIKVPTLVK